MSHKRIVVACDGTWNRPDQIKGKVVTPSNVVKLALAVAPNGGGRVQQVFYERGVGTGGIVDRIGGGSIGVGLSRNVLAAYRYLVKTYRPDDELFLFGFSRGAFTARSLAGLIGNCGILRPEHHDRVDDAFALYRATAKPTKPSGVEARLFRATYAHEDATPIRFIGVWDTVGALGIPVPAPVPKPVRRWLTRRWSFHDVQLGAHVQTAIHAMAIDERRRPFEPTPWQRQPEIGADRQTIEQAWFSGVHCDVGGGYLDPRLADITLLWMGKRAREAGLRFTDGWLTPTSSPDPKRRVTGEDVLPDALGTLNNSMNPGYALLGKIRREMIGTEGGAIAASALRRVTERDDYDPPNLQAYSATNPPTVSVVDTVG